MTKAALAGLHSIARPSGKLTPIMNMAIYEIVDGKIAA
jgi:hypothetical protein